jgi:hypothetical protein
MLLYVFSKNAFSGDISKNMFFHFWSFLIRASKIEFRVFGITFWDILGSKFIDKFIDFWGPKLSKIMVQKVSETVQKVVRTPNRVSNGKLKMWVEVRVFQFPSQKEA